MDKSLVPHDLAFVHLTNYVLIPMNSSRTMNMTLSNKHKYDNYLIMNHHSQQSYTLRKHPA